MANKGQLKIPIGFKMVTMMALMLVTSVVAVIYKATALFTEDHIAFIQKASNESATARANQTFDYVSHLASTLTTITEMAEQKISEQERQKNIEQQFKRNEEILGFSVWRRESLAADRVSMRDARETYASFLESLRPSTKAWAGEVDLQRVVANGKGYLTLSFPLSIDASKRVLTAAVSLVTQSKLIQIYGRKEMVTSYLVDGQGNVLAHPKEALVSTGANLKEVPIVKEMLESPINNKEMRFTDLDGKIYQGVFKRVGIGGVGVISQVVEDEALATVKKVKKESIFLAGIVLFLGFAAVYFFSKTLTGPIRSLVALTREIAAGNFKIKIHPKGHDEITELTKSFGTMATGLAERDRLKETFNKFHSKEIAEAILSGEVKLGGNRQEATVFFSDIRSFTSMSEEMEAEQVVEMLNEYMTAMVSEIRAYQGVVDKYVGDAIMAVWGVPMARPDDTWRAVRAGLAMRMRLAEFNKQRIAQGKKAIHIGMGLHTGELIAGNIGSNEKMEYTVIGDTVNTASRIESLTKEFGTDMLISEGVYLKVKERLIVEPVSAQVKGKSKALTAYKVRGYVDENGKEVMMETAYSSYEAGHSDKVVHSAA